MLVEAGNEMVSRVLQSEGLTNSDTCPFSRIEAHKKFNTNWWTIRSRDLAEYTKEEIEARSPEWVLQVVMPRRNREGKIEGQPIIELQTDREIEDTHIGIGGERYEIRKKTEKPMMCKKCLQFGHPKKYCTRNESYCNLCAAPINEDEEENGHTCRGEYCLYCEQEHKTGDKQKCEEYRRESLIKNKMAEQRCDIFEARKTLGISRGKSYAAIVREKKGGSSRTI